MGRFPGIRNIEVCTRVYRCVFLPWCRADSMQRNKVLFRRAAALRASMDWPVRAGQIRAARTDIKVLGIYGQSGSYIKFVAKPEITDPKQARKLGVVPGSVSEFATEQMLAKLGVDRKSVELVKAGPPEFPALLARGDV